MGINVPLYMLHQIWKWGQGAGGLIFLRTFLLFPPKRKSENISGSLTLICFQSLIEFVRAGYYSIMTTLNVQHPICSDKCRREEGQIGPCAVLCSSTHSSKDFRAKEKCLHMPETVKLNLCELVHNYLHKAASCLLHQLLQSSNYFSSDLWKEQDWSKVLLSEKGKRQQESHCNRNTMDPLAKNSSRGQGTAFNLLLSRP